MALLISGLGAGGERRVCSEPIDQHGRRQHQHQTPDRDPTRPPALA